MKRIKYAILEQTIHFQLKEDIIGHERAAKAVKDEANDFIAQLKAKNVQYKILDQQTLADDSIIMKLKRQYNNYDCGKYLD